MGNEIKIGSFVRLPYEERNIFGVILDIENNLVKCVFHMPETPGISYSYFHYKVIEVIHIDYIFFPDGYEG